MRWFLNEARRPQDCCANKSDDWVRRPFETFRVVNCHAMHQQHAAADLRESRSLPPVFSRPLQWKFVATYYGLACGTSWLIWVPLVFGEQGLGWFRLAPPAPVVISAGTIGPFLACFLTYRLETGSWRAVRIFPHGKLRLLWLLAGPTLIVLCFFVVFPALRSQGAPQPWRWHFGALAGIVIPMFNYNLLGGPLFEEFGWRGFLQSHLQRTISPWVAAIAVGVMWAVWHSPLFLVHGWTSASPVEFGLILVGLSTVIAFCFNFSHESVAVAILMHSAFNASPRFLESFMSRVATRQHPSAELLLAVSFLLVGGLLTAVTRGRLGCRRA